MAEENQKDLYDKVFKDAMKEYGVKSLEDFETEEKKKEFFEYVDSLWNSEKEPGPDGPVGKAAKKYASKAKKAKKAEKAEPMKESNSQHVSAILEAASSLDEETREKIKMVCETAINNEKKNIVSKYESLAEEYVEECKEEYESLAEGYVEECKEEYIRLGEQYINEYKKNMEENLSLYLDSVVNEWLEENKIAVQKGVRTQVTEEFISGLKSLFEDHYIEVPEEKTDVVAEMQDKIENLQETVDSQLKEAARIKREKENLERNFVFEDICQDLAHSQKERLAEIVKSIDASNTDEFETKVKTIRESYFPSNKTSIIEEEYAEDDEDGETPSTSNAFIQRVLEVSREES